jgi:hypothetical protein
MELDWLIFPSPDTSYTAEKSLGEIIFIPKKQEIKIKFNNNNNNNENNNDIDNDNENDININNKENDSNLGI